MRNSREQLRVFKEFLAGQRYDRENPLFEKALGWIRNFPGGLDESDKQDLRRLICDTFDLEDEELRQLLLGELPETREGPSPKELEAQLMSLVPNGGLFYRYAKFTEHSEAPLAYHLFCALLGVGATVQRRIWFDMGYYRLFPNLGVILLGPSGIKKTTAANIIIGMLQELELTKIYSEKLTPEQLVEAMKDMAQGVIYAPEMAVFLGRQRYMEGIVPLITRFMDCPDVWSSETIMRGKRTLHDVAISSLMCSTPEWFVSNTAEDVVSGGFIARNILVVQMDSPRIEPIPRPGNPRERNNLICELARIHQTEGQVIMSAECVRFHELWYASLREEAKRAEHEVMSTYYQRKQSHVIRVAMCLHLTEHTDLILDLECFQRAIAIMNWIEQFIPPLLKRMFKTAEGHEQEVVLTAIRAAGGVIDHSELLRRVQYRMNAQRLRMILVSLKEAELISEQLDKLQHVWVLKEVR